MRNKNLSIALIVIGFVGTLLGYTNCSPGFITGKGGAALSSIAAAQAACEKELINGFNNSYLPLMRNKCSQCHSDNGVAGPKLASSDGSLAYSTFRRYGPALVDSNATSTTHAPGISGPANATEFASAHTGWDNGTSSYNACLASQQGPGPTPVPLPTIDNLQMNARNIPAIYYNAGAAQVVEWNMSTEVTPDAAQFPGKFQVDIRVVYQRDATGTQTAIGYAFANPRVKLLSGEIEIEINGLVPKVEGVMPAGTENFGSATVIARGINYTNIYNGEIIVPMATVSTGDQISFAFRYFNVRYRTDNPPIPPTPTIALKGDIYDDYTRTLSIQLRSLSNDSTAVRYCITASPTPIRSSNDNCPSGYDTGELNGWFETRPQVNSANYMVDLNTSGRALNSGDLVTVYYYVANSDLKVNATPGIDTIKFDKDIPSVSTITGPASATGPGAPAPIKLSTFSATQVADLNITTSTDPIGTPLEYCINVSTDTRAPQNCNGVYVPYKPTFVGLPLAGTNYISVFVRDLANNVARPPQDTDVKVINNDYGRIAFDKLTTGGTAMSVFQNHCASCHAAGQSAATYWTSTDFTSSYNKRVSLATYSSARANPQHTGMLSAKESELVRIWLTQSNPPLQVGP